MTEQTSIKARIAEIPRDCPHHEIFANCENPFYLMADEPFRRWAENLSEALGITLAEFWGLVPSWEQGATPSEDRPNIPSTVELEYKLAKLLGLD